MESRKIGESGESMKTSINLPCEMIKQVREHNEKHPDSPINVSGVCRLALEATLEAKKTYYVRDHRVIRTVSDQQEPEKQDDDFDEIRNQWFTKNQLRILETTGKMEPNWNNILTKNPELGFKNPRELKNWILNRVSAKTTGQAEQTTDH